MNDRENRYKKFRSNDNLNAKLISDPYQIMKEKYGQVYVEYREKWAKSKNRDYLPDFPLHIDLDITRGCNAKCIYCFEHKIGWNGNLISTEFLNKIFEEIKNNEMFSMNLGFNAEPLLNKSKFFEVIDLVTEYNIMDVFVHSNALALDKEISEKIVNSNVTCMCFSIDAFSNKTYKKLKGISLEKVKENILYLISLKRKLRVSLPIIRVSFVVNESNIDEKDLFYDFWKEYADYVEYQSLTATDDTVDKNLFKKIKNKTCHDPWQRLSIYSNGDMFPCCSFTENLLELKLGNLKNMTIKEAWNSEKIKNLRKYLQNKNCVNNTYAGCETCLNSIYKLK